MADKKVVFNKDSFVPWRTAPRKVGRINTRFASAKLSKYTSKNKYVTFALNVSGECKDLLGKRYLPKISREVLALYPDELNGYAMSHNRGKNYRIQFAVDKETSEFLDHKLGEYKLKNDRDVLYIVFNERVVAGHVSEEDEDKDDVPFPEELHVPEIVSAEANTSVKKPMIVHQTPSGREGIVDRDALKLYDALVESTFVSIRDAKRLGLTDSAYKQALNKLVKNFGYCVLSVPIIEANGTKFYVSTLYNDGEWKE